MGTDYGRGMLNIDPDTGIRYGVIPANRIMSEALADFVGEDVVSCPVCGHRMNCAPDELICPKCQYKGAFEEDFYMEYTDGPLYYMEEGYELILDDYNDIIVVRAPFKTMAGFCSPCAPGACYLTDRNPDAWAYCLGPDWFDEGEMPYDVVPVAEEAKA